MRDHDIGMLDDSAECWSSHQRPNREGTGRPKSRRGRRVPSSSSASSSLPGDDRRHLSQPEQTGSELYQPDQTGSELYQPDQTGSELYQPDQTGSELYQPDQTGSELYQPDQTGSELYQPDHSGSDLIDPEQPGSGLIQPDPFGSELTDPDQPGLRRSRRAADRVVELPWQGRRTSDVERPTTRHGRRPSGHDALGARGSVDMTPAMPSPPPTPRQSARRQRDAYDTGKLTAILISDQLHQIQK